jgi:hypothetical protein
MRTLARIMQRALETVLSAQLAACRMYNHTEGGRHESKEAHSGVHAKDELL